MSIVVKNLTKSFGEPPTLVLKGIDTTFEEGKFYSITGRSGSGKSTLLYLISSLDLPTSGEIIIDDMNLHNVSVEDVHRFRNQKMGFVFQFHYLLPELTALENVLMPSFKTKTQLLKREYALSLLDEFGLKSKANRLPSQLSGGEQQRVAIARSLIMEPKYLFADEPTGNLDSVNGQAVLELFQRINKEKKTTILIVTHDNEFAKMAHETIHLVDGKIDSIQTN